MQIVDSEQNPPNPITVSTTPVNFDIKLFPASPNPGGIVKFGLLQDGNPISNGNIGIPDSLDIPADAISAGISGTIRPSGFPRGKTQLTLACRTTLSVFLHQIIIDQT